VYLKNKLLVKIVGAELSAGQMPSEGMSEY